MNDQQHILLAQGNTKAGNSIELVSIRFEFKQVHCHVLSKNGMITRSIASFITASAEQISEFLQFVAHYNNRPLQPLNARLVLQ